MGKKKGKKKLTVEPLPEVDSAGDDAFWDMIDGAPEPEPEPEPAAPAPAPAADAEEKKGPSKAARRRAAKAEKEAEEARQQRADALEALKEGPGKGESETATLTAQLGKLGKRVLEVSADGDCLYASVAHQLSPGELNRPLPGGESPSAAALRAGKLTPPLAHSTHAPGRLGSPDQMLLHARARAVVGKHLRANRTDFEPFADLEPLATKAAESHGGDAFEAYCERVVATHEWGGQLELQALVQILRAGITVHEAGKQPVNMGEEFAADATLHLSYHRHAYSLGEHYNSVVAQ
jgi:OTU domain-containing protein 6